MRRSLPSIVLATALLAAAGGAASQGLDGHPFRTMSPTALGAGEHVLETGLEYRTDAVPQPLLADSRGDLLRVPEVRYRIGFGRAELSVGGVAWQSFSADGPKADDDEPGDLSAWFSVTALKQGPSRPALGFALGVKWPNASDESGLGTDESDVFLAVLLGRANERFEWRVNVGLAVLGDPLADGSQEDVLTYGFGFRYGGRHALACEVYGRTFASDDARDLEDATLKAGYALAGERWGVEVSLLAGLTGGAGDLGLSAGAWWRFGAEP